MTPSGPERARVDLSRLRRADCAVAAGTVLYLLFLVLPWFSVDAADLGSGYRLPGASANGFDSGLLVAAAVLLVLATVWTLLPAFADVPAPGPRALPTAVLAALAAVLTLVEWLSTVDLGVTLMGLLALLTVLAVLAAAALRLLAELARPGDLPDRPARVVRWADRPVTRPPVPDPSPTPDDQPEDASAGS